MCFVDFQESLHLELWTNKPLPFFLSFQTFAGKPLSHLKTGTTVSVKNGYYFLANSRVVDAPLL